MRPLRRSFSFFLALSLLLGSLPAGVCASTCGGGQASLDCVRLCAKSDALFSQNGRLDTLGSGACGVAQAPQAPEGLLSAELRLSAPLLLALPSLEACSLEPQSLALGTSFERGPPAPTSYLGSQHPQANAPPSFC